MKVLGDALLVLVAAIIVPVIYVVWVILNVVLAALAYVAEGLSRMWKS